MDTHSSVNFHFMKCEIVNNPVFDSIFNQHIHKSIEHKPDACTSAIKYELKQSLSLIIVSCSTLAMAATVYVRYIPSLR